MVVNLTSGAISKIVNGKCTSDDIKPVVQVIKIESRAYTIDNKQWYFVWLSDGSFKEYVAITYEIPMSNKLQKGSIVQLTKFELTKIFNTSRRYILVCDLTLLRATCNTIGDPKPLHMETPLVVRSTPTIPHLNVEEPPTSIQNPSTSTQKCSSHSPTQNKKQKLQSNDDAISVSGKDISDVMKMMAEITNDVRVLYKKVEALDEDVSKMTRMMMEKNKEDDMGACFKKLETLEEDVSKLTRMMMEKNKEDVVGFKKLETLEEDVSKLTKLVMEKNKEDVVGFKKLETLEEDVSNLAKLMMDKNKEDVVGFKKLETLEEDVSKLTKLVMEKNKEDVVGFKKLETLEEDVSKMARIMMEKNKEDDMGACIEKLDKMGWGAEEPIYDTALLLFLKGADYRKLWLHLKPECCGKWVKIAGSIFGLLD